MPAMTLHHTDAPSRPAAPAVARPGRSAAEPESCEPELALWVAALVLLMEDASDYLRRGDDKRGIRGAAYRDVTTTGEMLRHLCAHARVDPHLAVEWWQRRARHIFGTLDNRKAQYRATLHNVTSTPSH